MPVLTLALQNDDVRQFIDLEAIEHGDSESEEDADPDLDGKTYH